MKMRGGREAADTEPERRNNGGLRRKSVKKTEARIGFVN